MRVKELVRSPRTPRAASPTVASFARVPNDDPTRDRDPGVPRSRYERIERRRNPTLRDAIPPAIAARDGASRARFESSSHLTHRLTDLDALRAETLPNTAEEVMDAMVIDL